MKAVRKPFQNIEAKRGSEQEVILERCRDLEGKATEEQAISEEELEEQWEQADIQTIESG